MPGRALDLYRPADTAHPFTDRAQAHSMFCTDIESAPIVGYGKLYRVATINKRHIHAPGVTVPRYIGECLLCNAVKRLFDVERQTPVIARGQLHDGIVAILPLENMFPQRRNE